MPMLVAKVPFSYAAKALKAGDVFEASDKDARLLRLINRAEDHAAAVPAPASEPQAAGDRLDLGQPPVGSGTSDEPKRSRRYQRRDMTAGE